jgi:ABC-type antimicrobial peptide transport system permease subunit
VRELSERDGAAIARRDELPVDHVAASHVLYSQDATVGAKTKPIGVQSGGTGAARLANLELLHGRWMQPGEESARVCVIGYEVWKDLFGGRWPLATDGLTINHGTRFRVVGVLQHRPLIGGGSGDGTWRVDRKIWVPTGAFLRAIRAAEAVDEITIRHEPVKGRMLDRKSTARRLLPYLQSLHLGAENFEFDALKGGGQLDALISVALTVLMLGCSVVAMTVGGVNVMNAQLVSLQERTREYGIHRALGMSASRLRGSVLMESGLFALAGSLAGVVLGLAATWLLSVALSAFVLPWPFVVVPWSVAAAFGVSGFTGVLAGWLPAQRTTRLSLSACLRAE